MASGRVEEDAARDMTDKSTIAKLLDHNILAVHPDGSYTFNARHVQAFFSAKCVANDAASQGGQ